MSQVRRRLYKYYDLVMALFVTILLCSNVIGAAKVCTVWGFTFGAGVLFFPISYIFNDVLTEVYGYARARKVVWAGFGAIIFASFMSWVIVSLPPAGGWNDQRAYETVFGQTPRIVFASRAMTSRSAPTCGARSILLMTSRSDRVTPGPPLRGILSPPDTSMT